MKNKLSKHNNNLTQQTLKSMKQISKFFGGGISYLPPEIEVTEIACDRGFGDSIKNERFTDGEEWSWD